jgi:hypothetical protein
VATTLAPGIASPPFSLIVPVTLAVVTPCAATPNGATSKATIRDGKILLIGLGIKLTLLDPTKLLLFLSRALCQTVKCYEQNINITGSIIGKSLLIE